MYVTIPKDQGKVAEFTDPGATCADAKSGKDISTAAMDFDIPDLNVPGTHRIKVGFEVV